MENLIYKKRTYKDILLSKQKPISIDNIISSISSLIFDSTSASKSTSTTNNRSSDYITLYNQLLLLDEKVFLEIIFKSSIIIENLFQKLSSDLSSLPNEETKISHLFTELARIDSISSNLRQILITSITRFNPSVITKINSMINIKPSFTNFQLKESKLFNDIKEYVISIQDQRDKLIQHMSIIEKISSNQLYSDLITIIQSNLVSKYQIEINQIEITECNKILSFFQEYSKRIDEDVSYFNLLFGKQEASIFNEKILQIVFMQKISDELLKDESFLSKLLEEKDYSTLKIILNLVRKKVQIAKEFGKVFFDFYYNKFIKDRKFPSSTSVKEGQIYLHYLIEKIDKVMKVFIDIFHNERIYQMKYNEILSKMTNCKEIRNIHLLIGIYINLHINSKNKEKSDLIYSPALLALIKNINDKEILFTYLEKFLLKRITTFNINLEKEKEFLAYLKLYSEIRHVMKYERMIRDLSENVYLNFGNDKVQFYLFSYNGLTTNDIVKVINGHNVDLLSIAKCYTEKYPHRQVTLSQTFSSALITFNKKADIVVNYIQAELLMLFNKVTSLNKGMTYEEIKNDLVDDNRQIPFFRNCIYALIECKILKTNGNDKELTSNDLLTPNFEYNETKLVFCFEKVNQPLRKSSSITEENMNVNNADNFELIILKNKIPIIDCAIMKILKNANPDVVPESNLVKALGTNETIKRLIDEQEIGLFIKKRIETLLERGLLQMKVIDNKITYCYFNS